MKKFIYRMQSILDVKRKLEDQERTNYSLARIKLNEEEEKLEQLKTRRNQYEEQLRNQVKQKLQLLEIKRLQDAIELMKVHIKVQMVMVNKAEQALELARKRLEFAMVERKTQERLREKAFENYRLEFDAQERKEIDELVSFTYGGKIKAEDFVEEQMDKNGTSL